MMNIKILILPLAACIMQAAFANSSRPNVILFLTDDQGWGDVGYNGHPHIQTPVLDEMAAGGARFNRFYAPAGVCAPSRAAIMTGRHNLRLGSHVPSVKQWHLSKDEWTVAEMLKEQGYATAHYGKWHLGTLYTDRPDSPHNLFPDEAGFDDYFSSENILFTYDPYQDLPMGKPADHMYVENGRFIPLEEGQANPSLRRDDATILADKTIEFIKKQSQAGKPFFVALWFHHVHSPLSDNPELVKLYPDVTAKEATYYSNITSVDREVGRVRQAVKDLGLTDNTMLWFTSDNGPHGATIGAENIKTTTVNGAPFRYGDRGAPGPYKGGKWRVWDGGIRVPAIIEWPGGIKQPLSIDAPCGGIDFMPTLMDLLNAEPPEELTLDGESILPLLQGRQSERTKPMAFVIAQQRAWMNGKYKIVSALKSKTFDQLYDMEKDPFETTNLIHEKPELFQRLLNEYKAWEKGAIEEAEEGPCSWNKGKDSMATP